VPRMITTRRMPAQNPMLYYIRFVMPSEDLANRLPRVPRSGSSDFAIFSSAEKGAPHRLS
jgi:hypothetical protein